MKQPFFLTAAILLPIAAFAESAFFQVEVAGGGSLVVQITQPDAIKDARDLMNGHSTRRVMMGKVVPSKVAYNAFWHFHLDPLTIYFTDVAIEACQAPASEIEAAPTNIGGATLPGFRWCPAVSIQGEIHYPPGLPSEPTNVSAADYAELGLAPGAMVSAFGPGLGQNADHASVSLVDKNGKVFKAMVTSVAPKQVNYILPQDLPAGMYWTTLISGSLLFSGPMYVLPFSPSLFSVGTAQLAAAWVTRVRADNSVSIEPVFQMNSSNQSSEPAPIDFGPDGDRVYLTVLGTGIRQRDNLDSIQLMVGGNLLPALYAGPTETAGIDQINVLLPRDLAGKGWTSIWTHSQVPFENDTCNEPSCAAGRRTLESQPVQVVIR